MLPHICSQVRFAHLLHGVEAFDARAFGTDGTEAGLMDPQQRLMLESVAEAIVAQRPLTAVLSGAKAGQVRLSVAFVAFSFQTCLPAPQGRLAPEVRLAKDYASIHLCGCVMHADWAKATEGLARHRQRYRVQWGTYLGTSWTDYSALVAANHGVTPYSATGKRLCNVLGFGQL